MAPTYTAIGRRCALLGESGGRQKGERRADGGQDSNFNHWPSPELRRRRGFYEAGSRHAGLAFARKLYCPAVTQARLVVMWPPNSRSARSRLARGLELRHQLHRNADFGATRSKTACRHCKPLSTSATAQQEGL